MENFINAWRSIGAAAHLMAVAKGFWETDNGDGEKIALMHSELSEMLEGLRVGNPPSDKIGAQGFSQAEEESADLVIRLMDLSARRGWRVAEAILAKMDYNAKRPHKHGKAF